MTKPTVFNYQEHEKLKADYDKLNQDYKDLLMRYARVKEEASNYKIRCRIAEADLEELRNGKST